MNLDLSKKSNIGQETQCEKIISARTKGTKSLNY